MVSRRSSPAARLQAPNVGRILCLSLDEITAAFALIRECEGTYDSLLPLSRPSFQRVSAAIAAAAAALAVVGVKKCHSIKVNRLWPCFALYAF